MLRIEQGRAGSCANDGIYYRFMLLLCCAFANSGPYGILQVLEIKLLSIFRPYTGQVVLFSSSAASSSLDKIFIRPGFDTAQVANITAQLMRMPCYMSRILLVPIGYDIEISKKATKCFLLSEILRRTNYVAILASPPTLDFEPHELSYAHSSWFHKMMSLSIYGHLTKSCFER